MQTIDQSLDVATAGEPVLVFDSGEASFEFVVNAEGGLEFKVLDLIAVEAKGKLTNTNTMTLKFERA